MATKRRQIFVPNNPQAPRLCPELAAEIGLTESILLLQLEYWIGISKTRKHDRMQWTYQSLAKIQETFTFWSKETIRRGLQHMEQLGLIRVSEFNRLDWDRTKWYALNLEEIGKLKSIRIVDVDDAQPIVQAISQNEKSISQNDNIEHHKMRNGTPQNETTIPEITTETTTETNNILFAESQKEIKAKPAKEKKAKREKKTPYSTEEINQVIETFAEANEYDPKKIFAQGKFYGQAPPLLDAKHTLDEIRGCIGFMRETNSAWWKAHPMNLTDVQNVMPTYLRELGNGWKPGQKGNGRGQERRVDQSRRSRVPDPGDGDAYARTKEFLGSRTG